MATTKSAPTIEKFGLQTGTERTIFATWKWSKSHTKEYKCIWYYATGDGVWFVGADTTETVKQSTYTAPENATKVKFKVKAIAKTHKVNKKDVAYWTGKFSSEKKYNFKSSPPSKPSAPEIGINEYNKTQIDLSISNLDRNGRLPGLSLKFTRMAQVIRSIQGIPQFRINLLEYPVRSKLGISIKLVAVDIQWTTKAHGLIIRVLSLLNHLRQEKSQHLEHCRQLPLLWIGIALSTARVMRFSTLLRDNISMQIPTR